MLTIEQIEWSISEFKMSFFDLYKEGFEGINLRCPFCGDSKKSKTKCRGWIYKNEGSYHCFNCGKTTSTFGLLAQIKSCSITDIKRSFYLANKNQESFVYKPIEEKPTIIQQQIDEIEPLASWVDLTEECEIYLKSRNIFKAPGFKKTNLYYDTKSDRIIFPWKENNKIVYYQARAIRKNQEPKYMFPKGLKKGIYGLDNLDLDEDYIFYTEGLIDSIFIKNGIAIGGIKPTVEQTQKLKEEYSDKKLVWFSDNYWVDDASKEAIIKVCEKNPKQLIFKWPKVKYKDVNEWVCKEKNLKKFWDIEFLQKNIITAAQAKVLIILNN